MKKEMISASDMSTNNTDRKNLANAIRALSMDAVEKAKSGHPGAPMGMADIAEVLWNDFMTHNPQDPEWINRDRFIMSNGHGSMLIYSVLHLCGYDLSIDDLKEFRQLHSKTPGHPEYGYAPGVETTTGPLGQGVANGVGMAIGEAVMAAHFNKEGHEIIDHHTYVTVGDGCLMEGISHEACSLAGTLGLGKLIVLFDSNKISIDGDVDGWFKDDNPARFEAYGWHVIRDVDGHNPEHIKQAIQAAKDETGKPSFIEMKTVIGCGSPNKQGTAGSHGAALGEEEIKLTRENIGWSHAPFEIPADVYAGWDAKDKGQQQQSAWQERFDAYQSAYPELAAELKQRMSGALPANWQEGIDQFIRETAEKGETIASRKASQNALNAIGPLLPALIGGSADLAGSNLTLWSGSKGISDTDKDGNYLYYGVREFGMTAINNGLALYGGFVPYGATFLMFSEYARNALRMAALMKVQNISVFTHDSIGLGEDGPTHQAVEQAATLRLMPNMSVWRPCDAVESAVAWKYAIERKNGPSSLLFSRQGLEHMPRTDHQIQNIEKGAYVLLAVDEPEAIVIATGSEVGMAMAVAKAMNDSGRQVSVVSMPSCDVFDQQDEDYRESVLPSSCRKRLAVEAGHTHYWRKYVGLDGMVLGLDTFGESAPAKDVFEHFGITEEKLTGMLKQLLEE